MKKGTGVLLQMCFALLATGQNGTNKTELFDNKVVVNLPAELKSFEKIETSSGTEYNFLNAGKTARLKIASSSESLEDNDVPDHTDKAISTIKLISGAVIIDDGISLNEGKNIGYFKFLTNNPNGRIFNLNFYGSLNDQLISGSFSCPEEQRGNWEKKMDVLIATLQIRDKIVE